MMQRLSGSLRLIAYSLYTLAGLIALAWLLYTLDLASWLPVANGLFEPAGAATGVLAGLMGWLAERSARGRREGTPSHAPATIVQGNQTTLRDVLGMSSLACSTGL